MLFGGVANAGDCPKQDLYAHKLDAYTIELDDGFVEFKITVSIDGVQAPDSKRWQMLLTDCKANRSMVAFEEWRKLWSDLSALGTSYQTAKWLQKFRLRKEIRLTEKEVAIQYARMLESFERETGISVLWNATGHPFAKGMISAGRGSEKVYDYILYQHGVQ